MAVIEIISTTYTKENAVVYEKTLNGRLIGLKIVPNEGFAMRTTEIIDDEPTYHYSYGYVSVAAANIPVTFQMYDAISINSIQEGVDV